MKRLIIYSLLILITTLSFGQMNVNEQQARMEEHTKFISYIKKWMFEQPVKMNKSFNSKTFQFNRYQYELEWNTSSQSWDTLFRYTYYTNRLGNNEIEHQGYVERYLSNGFVHFDSVYMRVITDLNTYKLPSQADTITVLLRFGLDTIAQSYRLSSELRTVATSTKDISQEVFRLYDWSHGQPSLSFTTFDSTEYFYSPNGALHSFTRTSFNFLSGDHDTDSSTVIANINLYPTQVSHIGLDFDGNYYTDSRDLYTYNSNSDLTRIEYQLPFSGQFFTDWEIRKSYLNGLLVIDSSIFSSSHIVTENYYYNSLNGLDSIVGLSRINDTITTLDYRRSFEYDSLNRIGRHTFLYYDLNGVAGGNSTRYVYPVTVGLSELEVAKDLFYLAPNPVENLFRIEGNFDETRLVIRNTSGAVVKEFSKVQPSSLINVEDITGGLYYVIIGNNQVLKMVKQ